MPHAMNFRLMQSNHGIPVTITTMVIDDSSKWETAAANANKLHLSNELSKPNLPQTVQPMPDQ